jgi:hypothetical protein
MLKPDYAAEEAHLNGVLAFLHPRSRELERE